MSAVINWERKFQVYLADGEPGIDVASFLLNYPESEGIASDSDEDRRMIDGFCAVVRRDIDYDFVLLILSDLFVRVRDDGYERLALVLMKLFYPYWEEFQSMYLGMIMALKQHANPVVRHVVDTELNVYRNSKDVSQEFLGFLRDYGL